MESCPIRGCWLPQTPDLQCHNLMVSVKNLPCSSSREKEICPLFSIVHLQPARQTDRLLLNDSVNGLLIQRTIHFNAFTKLR